MENKITWCVSILISLGLLGGMISPYSPIAIASKLETVAMRLDQKIVQDRIQAIQERIWLIEDRYYEKRMPQSVKEELRKLYKQMTIEKLKLKG